MISKTLVRNALQTPDGTVIESTHRHDYVTHVDAIDGKEYMLDGGLDYCRRSRFGESMNVYLEDGHVNVREAVTWGTYGKNGDEPYRRVLLKDMTDDHIEACLDTQQSMYPQIRKAFENELMYRATLYIPNIGEDLNALEFRVDSSELVCTSESPSTTQMVLQIDGDEKFTTRFFDENGDTYLTISPDGFSDGTTTIDIGDAAERFATWVHSHLKG